MTTHEAHIALNMIGGIGPATFAQLCKALGEPQNILRASASDLLKVPGVGEVTALSILHWEEQVDLLGELQRIQRSGVHVLIPSDDEYPPLLRTIYNPPFLLYVKGRILPQDRGAIALVGSRLTTLYGRETAQKLAHQLSYAGITVVSGGARGIDTAAHQGALAARGRTLAVLGNGIDVVYPAENAHLFEQIAENGALISQFPMSRTGDRQSYPIRNRVVAGITLGTVVVEANLTSGSLITAGMALELNRQVFAIPGRIDSPRSRGCHKLIKEGAKLCEDVQDILSEFECLQGLQPVSEKTSSLHTDTEKPSSEEGQIPLQLPTTATEHLSIRLTEQEKILLEQITSEEQSIDNLIRLSGLPSSQVQVALFGLELKKQVQQLPGKLYRRPR